MTVSVLVTILYFIPILYIGWIGYIEVGDGVVAKTKWESTVLRFADWFYMIMLRADMGIVGFVISVLIHIQIYGLLCVMQWCAWQVKVIQKKLEIIKMASGGNYRGVEMKEEQAPQVQLQVKDADPSDGALPSVLKKER